MCDFDLTDFSMISKDTTSDSYVIFATDPSTTENLVLKVSLVPNIDENNNGLEIEEAVYRIYSKNMIKNNFTPHLVEYHDSFYCKNLEGMPVSMGKKIEKLLKSRVKSEMFKNFLKSKTLQKEYPQIVRYIKETDWLKKRKNLRRRFRTQKDEELFSKFPNFLENEFHSYVNRKNVMYQILVLKKSFGIPLEVWLEIALNNNNNEGIRSVMFQIFYTLEVFNRLGLRHNDPHFFNILIEDRVNDNSLLPKTVYNIDGEKFSVPIKRNFVRIFDFDFSTVTCDRNMIHPNYHSLIDQFQDSVDGCFNKYAETYFCENLGICNLPDPKYDAMQVIHLAQTLAKDKGRMITGFLRHLGDVNYLQSAKRYLKGYSPTDKELKTNTEILLSRPFSYYKVSDMSPAQFSLPLTSDEYRRKYLKYKTKYTRLKSAFI
jgi:hypothetical protein